MIDKLSATARSNGVIEVYIKKDFSSQKLSKFRLYVDHKYIKTLTPISTSESTSNRIFTLSEDDFGFIPGHYYEIATEHNFFIPVDISYLATTEEFEEKYRYDGPLGAIYSKEETTFRVFSPFSVEINLHVRKRGSFKWETYSMVHHLDNGTFDITIKGDYDGADYLYERWMFGQSLLVADPYALSLASNSRWSFVINPERIREIPTYREDLPPFDDRTKACIYECDVRDMTSLTGLPDKGTYKALSTPGLKDKKGMPVGLDYLASLGVSHIQLMPVLDFQTIDEDNPMSQYNWGYDPVSYFSPEGSYAIDPHDPYSRVTELKQLISALHSKGLRVVLDVVYNHVYSNLYNPLNILCPNYYFRVDGNGNLSNGTGCGNDLESRNYMTRRLIIDSLMMCLDLYDVDGFRFDLMGILDIDTIRMGYQKLSAIRPELLYYGEGWDLWTALPADKKASYYNCRQMPFAAFFNDRFRDVTKGKSNNSEITVRGYLLGDTNYREGFKHVLLGSSVALGFVPMFDDYSQSINYVECHDNHTLYDKIKIACPDDNQEEIHKRIKLNIVATLLALGIPFFHQGEEIAASKQGEPNTYNAGDKLNGFDYRLLDKNRELYQFFKDAIQMKKEFIKACGEDYHHLISRQLISFENLENGALKIDYSLKKVLIHVIFNPSKSSFMYEFPNYVNLTFNDSGKISGEGFYIHMAIVNALSINVFYEKRNDQASTGEVSKEEL